MAIRTAADLLLKVEGLSKTYGGLKALDAVHLDVRYGEVHAVVGENGAGKSTVMKILGGSVKRDAGTTIFRGRPVEFHSPRESIAAGIAVIHQELSVLGKLSVVENVFMGRMPTVRGRIPWKDLERRTLEILAPVGLEVDPLAVMDDLSISQRQLIEIAKALWGDASLIIMDEPNSSLAEAESERLFAVIAKLKARDVSVLYVSHKIDEVLAISDRITTLRDGRYVGTVNAAETTAAGVIRMMVGRELTREYRARGPAGPPMLSVRGLSGRGFRDVSFELRKGEVLCFSGLVGSGRSELMRAIFGADPRTAGEVLVQGEPRRYRSPGEAIRDGLAMVPEDRKRLSLFMDLPIAANIAMAVLPRLRRRVAVDDRARDELVAGFVGDLAIKLGSPDDPVRSLSGGNQQKTVLARWLATRPRVLILDEPTHGIDVGAKSEIYELIRKLASSGVSILLVSSELPEVLAMADRVAVMHEGRLTGVLDRPQVDEHTIMAYATGQAHAVTG